LKLDLASGCLKSFYPLSKKWVMHPPGRSEEVPREIKEKSKLTKEEWKESWYFGGARQIEHEAMFPEELPKRLIKMYTFATIRRTDNKTADTDRS